MALIIPQHYRQRLLPETTEVAIKMIKDAFQQKLARALRLRRVTAPLFVLSGTGINDNLNGVEPPVRFDIACMGGRHAEVVHSLAKWKRMKLAAYGIAPGYGIYTDMNAIRTTEELDNLHSLYVDQWDWEKVMLPEERTLEYLKATVRRIYYALRRTEASICADYDVLKPFLPEEITFVHTEDLEAQYPELTPRQREQAAAEAYGAVFLIGIGGKMPLSGSPWDGRAPDYDDWTTATGGGHHGLNGDIIVYNPVLRTSYEVSSMGIRVDRSTLLSQLEERGATERTKLAFHQSLLSGELPQTCGGGIGQSRLCMLLLQKAHIGEIQASIWPESMVEECRRHNIPLL